MAYRDEVLADSPAAFWELNDAGGGGTVMDDSGPNGLDGTFDATNPPTLKQGGLLTSEIGGTCGLFNGTNQFASVGDNAALDLVNSFTLEGWVVPSTVTGGLERRWLGKGTVGVNGYSVGRTAANPVFFNMGVQAYTFTAVTLQANRIYHMVVVFDASQDANLYLNGQFMQTVTGTVNVTPGTASLFVGKSDVGTEYWDGYIDNVAVYPTILSAARIAAHWNAGNLRVVTPKRMPLGV